MFTGFAGYSGNRGVGLGMGGGGVGFGWFGMSWVVGDEGLGLVLLKGSGFVSSLTTAFESLQT